MKTRHIRGEFLAVGRAFAIATVGPEFVRVMGGRFSAVVVEHVGVGLQKEADVRMPDALADDLRAHTGAQLDCPLVGVDAVGLKSREVNTQEQREERDQPTCRR